MRGPLSARTYCIRRFPFRLSSGLDAKGHLRNDGVIKLNQHRDHCAVKRLNSRTYSMDLRADHDAVLASSLTAACKRCEP